MDSLKNDLYMEKFKYKELVQKKQELEQEKESNKDKELKELIEEFSSVFIKEVFKAMRKTIPEDKLIDGGFAEDLFTDMLDEELSRVSSSQMGFGTLNQTLYRQLAGEEEQGVK